MCTGVDVINKLSAGFRFSNRTAFVVVAEWTAFKTSAQRVKHQVLPGILVPNRAEIVG